MCNVYFSFLKLDIVSLMNTMFGLLIYFRMVKVKQRIIYLAISLLLKLIDIHNEKFIQYFQSMKMWKR